MAELPHPRNVDLLLVAEVNVLSPCCSCGKKDGGVMKCRGCQAVTYCGQECREKGRNNHDQICNTINQLLHQVKEAIEALANQYGGVEGLLGSPLVNDGLFRYRDNFPSSEDPRNFRFNENHGPTLSEKYDIARWKLIDAYAKCGKETLSGLAFRLAAENLLNMLRLSRSESSRIIQGSFWFTMHKYCGWMVAGGMDQEALNILSYVISGGEGLHFLDWSVDEDIEGVSLVQIVKEKIPKASGSTLWNHYFMLISLIKYKRIQALVAQRKEEVERWNTFMEGTQSSYGEIIKISGMSPVMEKLKGLVVDKSVDKRVDLLTSQINDMLNEVNEWNPKLIPGIRDGDVQMVDNPTYPETDYDKDAIEFLAHFSTSLMTGVGVENDIHKARYGVGKYGHAWHIDKDCTRALKLFLETGNVMTQNTSIPTSDPSGKDTNGGGSQCD